MIWKSFLTTLFFATTAGIIVLALVLAGKYFGVLAVLGTFCGLIFFGMIWSSIYEDMKKEGAWW